MELRSPPLSVRQTIHLIQLHFMKPILICFLGAALVLSAGNAYSQRPTEGPTSTGCYRQQVSPITYAPPLHSDMSLDVFQGYTWFDSMSRTFTSWDQIQKYADSIRSWDTLKYFMKYQYALSDYDDLLFQEYRGDAEHVDSAYHIPPGIVTIALDQREKAILGPRDKRILLAHAGPILHVRVISASTEFDSVASIPYHPLAQECIQATILDTIKGKHFLSYPVGDGPEYMVEFSFSPLWPKGFRHADLATNVDYTVDSNLVNPCPACFGTTSAVVDSEYIVFLGSAYLDYNGTYAYYDYWPLHNYEPEGGILPIVGGNVQDPSNYWGYGTSVPLATFLADLRADIYTLTHP